MKNLKFFGFVLSVMIITISCSDEQNDPIELIISDVTLSVDENPANGYLLGNVGASASGGLISYELISTSPEGAFVVDASTGDITVLDSALFDFEVNQTVSGVVEVTAGNVSDQVSVTFNLNDLYDDSWMILGGMKHFFPEETRISRFNSITHYQYWLNQSDDFTEGLGWSLEIKLFHRNTIAGFLDEYKNQLAPDSLLDGTYPNANDQSATAFCTIWYDNSSEWSTGELSSDYTYTVTGELGSLRVSYDGFILLDGNETPIPLSFSLLFTDTTF